MAKLIQEFKEFALKGNMVDMAIGIVIGAAFGTVVNSLVNDIIMPVFSGIFKAPDFQNLFIVLSNPTGATYTSVQAARDAGASVLAIGLFLNSLIAFLILAVSLFIVIKAINRMRRKQVVEPPAVPPAPTREEVLLGEIRDLLKDGRREPVAPHL